jgi:cytochrome c-type biogenesis protein CcmH/NrfG
MDEDRNRAEECYRRAKAAKDPADKRTWLVLAESYLLLSDFRQAAAATERMQDMLKTVEQAL